MVSKSSTHNERWAAEGTACPTALFLNSLVGLRSVDQIPWLSTIEVVVQPANIIPSRIPIIKQNTITGRPLDLIIDYPY
jgi:hypothetical protein